MTLDDAVVRFAELYRGRTDVQGRENGCCIPTPVTLGHYRGHLQGRFGLGIYPLRDDGSVAWGAIDVDRDDLDAVLLLRRLLSDAGLGAFVLTSRSKGFHITVFIDGWARASQLRHVLRAQLLEAGLPGTTEIYPRRDYRDSDSKAPGGYLRLPYPGAMATGQPNRLAAPGRRVALDPTTLRPLDFEAFLDEAKATRVAPDLIRALAEESGVADEEADEPPAPQAPTVILPDDPAELGLKPRFTDLIRLGWSQNSGYPSRSEAQQAVTDALVNVGYDDATIRSVLLHPAYGISARALERAPYQAEADIARCIAKARATSQPRRPTSGGLIPGAVHRHMLDLGLPPLAWQVLAEIAATADYRTGVSLVTPDSIARRIGRSRASIYRDAIEPLREAGVLEAVPLERQGGRWRRVGHRVRIEAASEAPRECEIREVSSRRDTVGRKAASLLASRNGTASTRRDTASPTRGDAARKSASLRPSATAPCLPGETR